MKTYIKFLIGIYLKSFVYVFFVMLSLILILNILSEVEYFKNYEVNFKLEHTKNFIIGSAMKVPK